MCVCLKLLIWTTYRPADSPYGHICESTDDEDVLSNKVRSKLQVPGRRVNKQMAIYPCEAWMPTPRNLTRFHDHTHYIGRHYCRPVTLPWYPSKDSNQSKAICVPSYHLLSPRFFCAMASPPNARLVRPWRLTAIGIAPR